MKHLKHYAQITLGRSHYATHEDMIKWCRKQFGEGVVPGLPMREAPRWAADGAFGYMTLYFAEASDLDEFKRFWKIDETTEK